MKKLFFGLLILSIFGCSENSRSEETKDSINHSKTQDSDIESNDELNTNKDVSVTYNAVYHGEIGWGYQIFKGRKLVINQEHIPAVNGLHGFKTQHQAELAAEFVIEKMKEGWDRPTVKAEELDSIGAIDLDSLMNSI